MKKLIALLMLLPSLTLAQSVNVGVVADSVSGAVVAPAALEGRLALADSAAQTAEDIGLGDVENTALSTWEGSGNLTRTGIVTNGTWSANMTIGTVADLPIITGTNGTLEVGAFGNGSTDFAPGDHGHDSLTGPLTVNGTLTVTELVKEEGPRDVMFMVWNSPASEPWTDFELKGSTDAWTTLDFFYHSPDPTGLVLTSQVWGGVSGNVRPGVWFTDSQAADRRLWIAQNTTNAISDMLTNMNSFVGGWIIVVRDLPLTRAQIETMQWSITLMDDSSTEDDPAARSIWRPIIPVRMVEPGWVPGS